MIIPLTDAPMAVRLTHVLYHARQWHGAQQRKFGGEPYWRHCENVGLLLSEAGEPGDVVAAGFLHDVLEDTDVTPAEIMGVIGPLGFSSFVLYLVEEVTNTSRPSDGTRARRKAIERERLVNTSPPAKNIKLADIIDNTRNVVELNSEFAKVYLPEKRALLEVLGDASNKHLLGMAYHTLAEAEKRLAAIA